MGIATNGFPISGAIHNDSISNPASVNTFPSSAQFLTNSSTLSPGARIQLLKFIKLVSERDPQAAIEVIGHTDSYGPLSSNLTLSRERASSVRNFLVTHGLGANPISTIGVGPNQPLVPDKTPAGVWIPANMAKNRRVDIKLLS
jgi:outer membrane protein OmpA-like peptidoglycan-associated protein